MAAGVLTWIYALGVLIIPWVARSLPPGMDLENFVKRGNQAAFIFCYTGVFRLTNININPSFVDTFYVVRHPLSRHLVQLSELFPLKRRLPFIFLQQGLF